MAVEPDVTQPVEKFENLYLDPTIDQLTALSPEEFEGFVEYVFACAGYAVENVARHRFPDGPGVDLNLYADSIGRGLLARVEARKYTPPRHVSAAEANVVSDRLHIADGIPGYIVTTSDFAPGARAVAAAAATNGRLRLVNGEHLLRYIAYIRGSRISTNGQRLPTTPAPTPPDILFDADRITRRTAAETTVLVVGNNRGGVAKTTTALNLGLGLTQRSWRVLLVDMDPQASLTAGLPPEEGDEDSKLSLLDYFVGRSELPPAVRKTRFPKLYLLPSHPDMRMLETGGGAQPHKELAFVAALHNVNVIARTGEKFDWIIIDTPPGQSFYTRAALAASHYAVVPITLDAWSAEGVNGFIETRKAMKGLMGTGVDWAGWVYTRFRLGPMKDQMQDFENGMSARGVPRLHTVIRFDDRLEQLNRGATGGADTGIFRRFRQAQSGIVDYKGLVEEVMQRVHHN